MYFPVLVPEHVDHVLQELCHQGLGHQGLLLEQACHVELMVSKKARLTLSLEANNCSTPNIFFLVSMLFLL